MCLHPQLVTDIPEQTVEVAKAAYPKGNVYMQMRDELGVLRKNMVLVRVGLAHITMGRRLFVSYP